jgi:hypothetical protein
MDPVSGNPGPACDDYPAQANATSSSTTLIWWALSQPPSQPEAACLPQ